MKTFLKLLIVFCLAAFMVTPALALGTAFQDPAPVVTLSAAQIVVVGVVASALVVVLRLLYELAAKKKFVIHELWMQAIVFVAAGALTYFWYPFALPALPAFDGEFPELIQAGFEYLGAWLSALSAMFVVAHLIYKLLIERVKNELGKRIAPAAYLPRRG